MGNRKFTNEKAVIKDLVNKKIKKEAIMSLPQLKSPAQLETVLKMVLKWEKKAISAFIDNRVDRPNRGYHLVDETDRREAIENPGVEDFADIPTLESPKKVSKKALSSKKLKNRKPTKKRK